jgi:hypothetical protein
MLRRLAPVFIAALLFSCAGAAAAQDADGTPFADVTVERNTPGAVVTDQILGMNMANWFNLTAKGESAAFAAAGIRATRWPGGSQSDLYHFSTNTECDKGYVDPDASFDDFINDIAAPNKLDVAVTLNYGSNVTCTGGEIPAEAALWVAYALAHGNTVSHWTVGNESYGSWEYDLHPEKHNATTYAQAVATGFYPDIKAANPKTLVGVVVSPGYNWDQTVLANAKYDFVEYHYYAQTPGKESDAYLVGEAADEFAAALAEVKSELVAAGKSSTPIYVGELGSVYASPGKQSTSITQALFAGEALGEMMNAGISRATWWLGYGSCTNPSTANFSSSLYGWQNFGGYQDFSDGTPEYGCPDATAVPMGTLLPTARAYQLFSLVAKDGEHALPIALAGNDTNLRAYAATAGTGTAIVLFNTSKTDNQRVSLAIAGMSSSTEVVETVYDRAIYDKSKSNIWEGPHKLSRGPQILPLKVTLTPWSMTVIQVEE